MSNRTIAIADDIAESEASTEAKNAATEIPTVAVFVRGGLVQDVCFDGSVRVVVIDFDTDNEGKGIYCDPDTGKHSYVDGSMWERSGDPEDDRVYVRAALRAFNDPFAPFRDNEEERARIQRELEEGAE